MDVRVVLCAGVIASAACRAQIELPAHPPPVNTGLSPLSALFFDLQALSEPVVVTGLSTGNEAFAGQPFQFELLIRDGSCLGGSATSGPASSLSGWTSLGVVDATQGPISGQVSLPVTIPRFVVEPGHTVGVALWFRFNEGLRCFVLSGPNLVYHDSSLMLTTGESWEVPFTNAAHRFPGCVLVGSIYYLPDPCYPNCDLSTIPPTLNVNDFVCFMTKFAQGDPYANCDGSTAPPVLNVGDFVCFTQRFAGGCS